MSVTLSTGEVVSFKPWKRKAERLFQDTLKQGVFYRRDMNTGVLDPVEEIPASNYDKAYEAVLSLAIDTITKDGSVPYSQVWHDELFTNDYDLLYAEIMKLRREANARLEKKD